MRVRLDPLNRLRKRARAVLRPVLPALVVGWVGAAGPCVGMAAAPEGGAPALAEAREHASAHAGHGAPAQAPRAAAAIDGAPKHDDAAPGHAHGACPHCPGSAGTPADAHARCAALDDVSDAKREPHPAKPDVKGAVPSVAMVGLRDAPAAARQQAFDDRVFPPCVRLNLRYCILIV